jgi:hypothetical protein
MIIPACASSRPIFLWNKCIGISTPTGIIILAERIQTSLNCVRFVGQKAKLKLAGTMIKIASKAANTKMTMKFHA